MIFLRPARKDELKTFDELDHQAHARNFVNKTGIDKHEKSYSESDITYLTIENEKRGLCGYFILVKELASSSVEFRRVLIDQNQRGIGQSAIAKMEAYCENQLDARRIWLDVYEDNYIGMHIYEKMGYKKFDEKKVGERMLFFYEKTIG